MAQKRCGSPARRRGSAPCTLTSRPAPDRRRRRPRLRPRCSYRQEMGCLAPQSSSGRACARRAAVSDLAVGNPKRSRRPSRFFSVVARVRRPPAPNYRSASALCLPRMIRSAACPVEAQGGTGVGNGPTSRSATTEQPEVRGDRRVAPGEPARIEPVPSSVLLAA
jgi:hypothetical protein